MNKTKKPSGATLGSDDLRVITNGRPNPKPRLAGQQPETLIEESPAVFRRRDDGFFVVTRSADVPDDFSTGAGIGRPDVLSSSLTPPSRVATLNKIHETTNKGPNPEINRSSSAGR